MCRLRCGWRDLSEMRGTGNCSAQGEFHARPASRLSSPFADCRSAWGRTAAGGIRTRIFRVGDYLNGGNWALVKEFVEVESGKRTDRPMLAEAIKACRAYGAKLVIAKLDRLSRDAHFLLGLEKAGIDFVAADMPNANRLTVGIMAMVAEEERRMISKRTKDALAAAKQRGQVLGGKRVR